MGMFDEFHVSQKWAATMPCGCVTREFQTKDLDCFLDRYEVADDGTCVQIGTLMGRPDRVTFAPSDCVIEVYHRCAMHETWLDVEIAFRGGKVVFRGKPGEWRERKKAEIATLRAQLAEAREAARVLAEYCGEDEPRGKCAAALATVEKWEGK